MRAAYRPPICDLTAVRQLMTHRWACSRRDWAIVLGGADCVWQDVNTFEYGIHGGPWPGLFFAANDIGVWWTRPLDHWVSFHVDKLKAWVEARHSAGHPRVFATWGWRPEHIGNQTEFAVAPWAGGSSGMLAVQVALELGCRKVILCGMPMTSTPHFVESQEFTPATTTWTESDQHWRDWLRVKDLGLFEDRVRSMSGRTKALFGEPTRQWVLS